MESRRSVRLALKRQNTIDTLCLMPDDKTNNNIIKSRRKTLQPKALNAVSKPKCESKRRKTIKAVCSSSQNTPKNVVCMIRTIDAGNSVDNICKIVTGHRRTRSSLCSTKLPKTSSNISAADFAKLLPVDIGISVRNANSSKISKPITESSEYCRCYTTHATTRANFESSVKCVDTNSRFSGKESFTRSSEIKLPSLTSTPIMSLQTVDTNRSIKNLNTNIKGSNRSVTTTILSSPDNNSISDILKLPIMTTGIITRRTSRLYTLLSGIPSNKSTKIKIKKWSVDSKKSVKSAASKQNVAGRTPKRAQANKITATYKSPYTENLKIVDRQDQDIKPGFRNTRRTLCPSLLSEKPPAVLPDTDSLLLVLSPTPGTNLTTKTSLFEEPTTFVSSTINKNINEKTNSKPRRKRDWKLNPVAIHHKYFTRSKIYDYRCAALNAAKSTAEPTPVADERVKQQKESQSQLSREQSIVHVLKLEKIWPDQTKNECLTDQTVLSKCDEETIEIIPDSLPQNVESESVGSDVQEIEYKTILCDEADFTAFQEKNKSYIQHIHGIPSSNENNTQTEYVSQVKDFNSKLNICNETKNGIDFPSVSQVVLQDSNELYKLKNSQFQCSNSTILLETPKVAMKPSKDSMFLHKAHNKSEKLSDDIPSSSFINSLSHKLQTITRSNTRSSKQTKTVNHLHNLKVLSTIQKVESSVESQNASKYLAKRLALANLNLNSHTNSSSPKQLPASDDIHLNVYGQKQLVKLEESSINDSSPKQQVKLEDSDLNVCIPKQQVKLEESNLKLRAQQTELEYSNLNACIAKPNDKLEDSNLSLRAQQSELENSNLNACIPKQVELEGSNLNVCISVQQAELENSKLFVCGPKQVELEGSNLNICIPKQVELEGSNLNVCIPKQVELEGSNLNVCIPKQVELEGSNLNVCIPKQQVKLEEFNLRLRAQQTELEYSNLNACIPKQVELEVSNLNVCVLEQPVEFEDFDLNYCIPEHSKQLDYNLNVCIPVPQPKLENFNLNNLLVELEDSNLNVCAIDQPVEIKNYNINASIPVPQVKLEDSNLNFFPPVQQGEWDNSNLNVCKIEKPVEFKNHNLNASIPVRQAELEYSNLNFFTPVQQAELDDSNLNVCVKEQPVELEDKKPVVLENSNLNVCIPKQQAEFKDSNLNKRVPEQQFKLENSNVCVPVQQAQFEDCNLKFCVQQTNLKDSNLNVSLTKKKVSFEHSNTHIFFPKQSVPSDNSNFSSPKHKLTLEHINFDVTSKNSVVLQDFKSARKRHGSFENANKAKGSLKRKIDSQKQFFARQKPVVLEDFKSAFSENIPGLFKQSNSNLSLLKPQVSLAQSNLNVTSPKQPVAFEDSNSPFISANVKGLFKQRNSNLPLPKRHVSLKDSNFNVSSPKQPVASEDFRSAFLPNIPELFAQPNSNLSLLKRHVSLEQPNSNVSSPKHQLVVEGSNSASISNIPSSNLSVPEGHDLFEDSNLNISLPKQAVVLEDFESALSTNTSGLFNQLNMSLSLPRRQVLLDHSNLNVSSAKQPIVLQDSNSVQFQPIVGLSLPKEQGSLEDSNLNSIAQKQPVAIINYKSDLLSTKQHELEQHNIDIIPSKHSVPIKCSYSNVVFPKLSKKPSLELPNLNETIPKRHGSMKYNSKVASEHSDLKVIIDKQDGGLQRSNSLFQMKNVTIANSQPPVNIPFVHSEQNEWIELVLPPKEIAGQSNVSLLKTQDTTGVNFSKKLIIQSLLKTQDSVLRSKQKHTQKVFLPVKGVIKNYVPHSQTKSVLIKTDTSDRSISQLSDAIDSNGSIVKRLESNPNITLFRKKRVKSNVLTTPNDMTDSKITDSIKQSDTLDSKLNLKLNPMSFLKSNSVFPNYPEHAASEETAKSIHVTDSNRNKESIEHSTAGSKGKSSNLNLKNKSDINSSNILFHLKSCKSNSTVISCDDTSSGVSYSLPGNPRETEDNIRNRVFIRSYNKLNYLKNNSSLKTNVKTESNSNNSVPVQTSDILDNSGNGVFIKQNNMLDYLRNSASSESKDNMRCPEYAVPFISNKSFGTKQSSFTAEPDDTFDISVSSMVKPNNPLHYLRKNATFKSNHLQLNDTLDFGIRSNDTVTSKPNKKPKIIVLENILLKPKYKLDCRANIAMSKETDALVSSENIGFFEPTSQPINTIDDNSITTKSDWFDDINTNFVDITELESIETNSLYHPLSDIDLSEYDVNLNSFDSSDSTEVKPTDTLKFGDGEDRTSFKYLRQVFDIENRLPPNEELDLIDEYIKEEMNTNRPHISLV